MPAFDKVTIPYYNLYFGDSWRIKPTLTVNYGLGWTVEMPPVEDHGKQIVLVDANDKPIGTEDYLNARKAAALAGQVYNPEIGFALITMSPDTRSILSTPSIMGLARVLLSLGPRVWAAGCWETCWNEQNGGPRRLRANLRASERREPGAYAAVKPWSYPASHLHRCVELHKTPGDRMPSCNGAVTPECQHRLPHWYRRHHRPASRSHTDIASAVFPGYRREHHRLHRFSPRPEFQAELG